MLIKILFFYYLFNLTLCINLSSPSCILKDDKIFLYGGRKGVTQNNKDVFSVKLEGLELKYQKAEWKFEKIVEDMPPMLDAQPFNLGNNSNEILNFDGYGSIPSFNILNIENFKIRNNTKGLKELWKTIGIPDGPGPSSRLVHNFIQSDVDLSKFYLINSYMRTPGRKDIYINLLIYNALEESWKDTKLLFYINSKLITVVYNDLIYVIKLPDLGHKSFYGYIINIEKSEIIKFIPKGDIPSTITGFHYAKHENKVYFLNSEKQLFFTFYVFNLDTLIWEKQSIDDIVEISFSCLVFYQNYIIMTFGNSYQKNGYIQIIDTNNWKKVYGINIKENNDQKTLISQIDNSEKVDINKAALIGGLVGGGVFIGLVIIVIYFYYKKRRKFKFIKPPEFITEHELIKTLGTEDKKPLTFRFSVKSNISEIDYDWDPRQPEAIYSMNNDINNILSKKDFKLSSQLENTKVDNNSYFKDSETTYFINNEITNTLVKKDY